MKRKILVESGRIVQKKKSVSPTSLSPEPSASPIPLTSSYGSNYGLLRKKNSFSSSELPSTGLGRGVGRVAGGITPNHPYGPENRPKIGSHIGSGQPFPPEK